MEVVNKHTGSGKYVGSCMSCGCRVRCDYNETYSELSLDEWGMWYSRRHVDCPSDECDNIIPLNKE